MNQISNHRITHTAKTMHVFNQPYLGIMMYAPFYLKLCSSLAMNWPGDSLVNEDTWLNHNIILLQDSKIYEPFEKKVF